MTRQIGRAVAAILSLPIKSEGSDTKNCLENIKDEVVFVNSFNISQRTILESALRVSGTQKDDWTMLKEPAEDR